MKIVVLDGYTLNPGDLSWEPLKALGECEIHDRSAPEEVVPRAREAEIVLTNKTVVNAESIPLLPRLRYIGVLATGYNVVDASAAQARGVPVTNVPTYGTRSVAQMTFALLLELTQRVGHHAQTTRSGRWNQCPDFCYWDFPLIELDGLTIGIIGFGRIGRAVSELAAAFGMRLLVHSRSQPEGLPACARCVGLDTLLRESDVVSLHCPLTEKTRNLMNRERLSLMKPTAFLLNTSRGPLVDEAALAHALNAGTLAGAGLDVLALEPPRDGSPLFQAPNCYVTPHVAWATRSARSRLLDIAVENVRAFLKGRPQNVVNGDSNS
jgi:glycerate dehydrogenase